jgi:hypothetical protein
MSRLNGRLAALEEKRAADPATYDFLGSAEECRERMRRWVAEYEAEHGSIPAVEYTGPMDADAFAELSELALHSFWKWVLENGSR